MMAANTKEDRGVNASEILVRVGTGSLGRRMVNRLRGPGYEVRTLSRSACGAGVADYAGKYKRACVGRGRSFVRSLRVGPSLVAIAVCVLFAPFGTAL